MFSTLINNKKSTFLSSNKIYNSNALDFFYINNKETDACSMIELLSFIERFRFQF